MDVLQQLVIAPAFEGRRWYQIGRMWLSVGETAKARAALEQAREAEPGAFFTTLLLGQVYEQTGAADRAVALYRE